MTSVEIIEEIKHLPPEQREEVLKFVREWDQAQRLSGSDLTTLAQRLAETPDPNEAASLKEEIKRGFYGKKRHAENSAE